MTVTDRTAASDAEFRSRIAPFESAVTPPEVVEARVVEEVARALCGADADVDNVRWSWDDTGEATRTHYRHMAAAAVTGYRAAQDGGAEEAVRRVEALAAEYERTPPGTVTRDRDVALDLRAALAPQAGEDWGQHVGSCRIFYAERRCTCIGQSR